MAKIKEEKPGIGHNRGISRDQLEDYLKRIEHLVDEKKAIGEDISEVFKEAKANGFDPKIMRKVLVDRKMDSAEREEQESLLDMYRTMLGMISADDEV